MIFEPHHDGSELYVSNSAPKLGQKVTFKVRIPNTYKFKDAVIRYYHDGEPRTAHLKKLKQPNTNRTESWWGVTIEIINHETRYRFLFAGAGKYDWLSAAGLTSHDVHSNTDFQLIARPEYPKWLHSSIFYQIFPDRFAKTSEKKLPDWAVARDWDLLPRDKSKFTGIEVYGGDLKGVEEHLDHISELGANGIYFTPFFPSLSNHRYDACSFDEVDPILGGNDAWFSLVKAANKKKIRLVGDITSNHCGAGHYWLAKAKKDKKSKEANFFYWTNKYKWGYEGWWGLKSLPKLNYGSKELRKVMYESPNSIIRKWLSPKWGMAGWRVDVGNMTGKYGEIDIHDEVMYGIRKAVEETRADAWLVAENADFVANDLAGAGWHGTMNYQGFSRPLSSWMNESAKLSGGFQGLPIDSPKITGKQFVDTIKNFNGSIPWRALVASMILLDSHDTPRFRTIVSGDKTKHVAGMTMLMTYPGVPSIFMGDELGFEGKTGEDSRRTINWIDRSKWDIDFFAEVKHLAKLRRSEDAFINGGLRWVAAENNYLAYLRESKKSSVLVVIAAKPCTVEIDLSKFGYKISKTLYGQKASGNKIKFKTNTATQGVWKLS